MRIEKERSNEIALKKGGPTFKFKVKKVISLVFLSVIGSPSPSWGWGEGAALIQKTKQTKKQKLSK